MKKTTCFTLSICWIALLLSRDLTLCTFIALIGGNELVQRIEIFCHSVSVIGIFDFWNYDVYKRTLIWKQIMYQISHEEEIKTLKIRDVNKKANIIKKLSTWILQVPLFKCAKLYKGSSGHSELAIKKNVDTFESFEKRSIETSCLIIRNAMTFWLPVFAMHGFYFPSVMENDFFSLWWKIYQFYHTFFHFLQKNEIKYWFNEVYEFFPPIS